MYLMTVTGTRLSLRLQFWYLPLFSCTSGTGSNSGCLSYSALRRKGVSGRSGACHSKINNSIPRPAKGVRKFSNHFSLRRSFASDSVSVLDVRAVEDGRVCNNERTASSMNPIKQKMISLLTEAAVREIEAVDPQSSYARELGEIEVDDVVEEIQKICNAATLAETTRVLLLLTRLKKASGQEREAIKSDLKRIAEQLVTRVEKESGQLRLPKTCRRLLLDL